MKRLNPETNTPFKFGDVRSDGYLFRKYQKTKIKKNGFFSEIWILPEVFQREKIKEKERYRKNAEKIKEKNAKKYKENPEKEKAKVANWKKNNPAKVNAFTARRRAARLQQTPKWLTKEQHKDIEFFYLLAKTKTKETGVEHHVDHIVPLRGKDMWGLHVPWNLQVITAKENLHKSNR